MLHVSFLIEHGTRKQADVCLMHNLKRKHRSCFKSKVPTNQDSPDEKEATDSQIGSINIYNHHEEQEG